MEIRNLRKSKLRCLLTGPIALHYLLHFLFFYFFNLTSLVLIFGPLQLFCTIDNLNHKSLNLVCDSKV